MPPRERQTIPIKPQPEPEEKPQIPIDLPRANEACIAAVTRRFRECVAAMEKTRASGTVTLSAAFEDGTYIRQARVIIDGMERV